MLEPFNPLAGLIWLADFAVSRLGYECPEGNIPHVDESEIGELLPRLGLKPPIEYYITEGLIKEILISTKYWSKKEQDSSPLQDSTGKTKKVLTSRGYIEINSS
jgi:hypothetical protein